MAAAVHVVVRLGWHNAPAIPPDVRPEYSWQAAREALAAFGLCALEITWSGVPAAIAAGAIAAYLLLRVERDPENQPGTPGFVSGIGRVGVAAALSIAPVLAVHLFKLTYVSRSFFRLRTARHRAKRCTIRLCAPTGSAARPRAWTRNGSRS